MWDSPIKITEEIVKQMDMVVEDGIMKAIQKVNIDVNKEELLKALAYDRNQYEKGFDAAMMMKEKADGCAECAFEHTESWEQPCTLCKRNHKDYWREKKV